MEKIKNIFNNLIEDESGQGATEYILLLVVIVALVMTFQTQIKQAVSAKLSALTSKMGEVN